MTEAEWTRCEDLLEMLVFLKYDYRKHTARKLRLFACACCRSVWAEIKDEHARQAVEVAERLADGLANENDVHTAISNLNIPLDPDISIGPAIRAAFTCLDSSVSHICAQAAYEAVGLAIRAVVPRTKGWRDAELREMIRDAELGEKRRQCDMLRDMFGPLPFHATNLAPHCLIWNKGSCVRIAQTIYDTRRFNEMSALGTALENAGCDAEDILSHCRGPGSHVKGCWVVDLVLGKQ